MKVEEPMQAEPETVVVSISEFPAGECFLFFGNNEDGKTYLRVGDIQDGNLPPGTYPFLDFGTGNVRYRDGSQLVVPVACKVVLV